MTEFTRSRPPGSARWYLIAALMLVTLAVGIAVGRYILTPEHDTEVAGEEETSTKTSVDLDEEKIASAGIAVVKVEAGGLSAQVIAQATVAATPEGAAVIGARADGTVTRIGKRLGDAVRRGEVLGSIQSREAALLAQERAAAVARLVRAQQTYNRQQNLLAANATSRQDFDAAEAELQVAQAERARADAASRASGLAQDGVSLNILSPVAGRITAAPAVLGAYVVAGTELFRVADPAKLEVHAAVPSSDAQRVRVGDVAIIELSAGNIAARVRAITPDVSTESRAATVVLLPSSAAALQPGQLVSARIIVGAHSTDENAVLVPTEALQKIQGEDAVFVRTAKGFAVRKILPGPEAGTMTEVRSGLKPGDRIAGANAFLLKAELEKGSGGDSD